MSEEKTHNKVVVVDENDKVVGSEMLFDAIEKGMIRRASRVYVFNESGQLLVQRRSENVLKPLLLDQSAAGHVDEGESYLQAAKRELFEELGIKDVVLKEIAISHRTEHFFSAIFKVIVPDNIEIDFDPVELDAVYWYGISDLEQTMAVAPEKFTPEFLEAWNLLRDKLLTQ
ncbi:NUDIX domain-containing protein [Candidatus Nomurabacteria bacterium]|nr:NUDIX domain-containing protein [Candidatus Nomurabacteria bacterium]